MPGCGQNVCITAPRCTSRVCNKNPVGPTVNSSADMMTSSVMARAGPGLFPRIMVADKGVKITRPAYYDVARANNYGAWSNATLCCD